MSVKPSNISGGSNSPGEFNKKAVIITSIIVGVLLVVGVSYGVYYKVSNKVEKTPSTNQTVNTNQEVIPAKNNKTDNNVSNWKTYQDTKNGFEVQYPQNFVAGGSLTGNCEGVSFTDKDFASSHDVSMKKMVDFHVFVGENSESCVSGHFTSPAGPDTIALELVNSESVTINDRVFLKKNYKDVVSNLNVKPFKFSSWHITNNGDRYTFVYNNGVGIDPEPHMTLFNQILSTFKFTDSTANWKTYKSDIYGYEFKYPADWKILEGESADNPTMISIRKASTQKAIDDAKSAGNLYGPMLDDIVVYYYNSVADEPANKTGKLGATTVDELIQKNTLITKVGTEQVGNMQGTGVMWAGHLTDYVVLVTSNSHLYEISFTNRGSKDEVSSEERQILSTFKFTNSEDFSVKELGIKFKVDKELKDDLIYSYQENTDMVTGKIYKSVYFATKSLEEKNKSCTRAESPLGALSRYEGQKADYNDIYWENRDGEIKQFDTSFIYYSRPQAPCSKKDVEYVTNQLRLFNENLPGGIEEIK